MDTRVKAMRRLSLPEKRKTTKNENVSKMTEDTRFLQKLKYQGIVNKYEVSKCVNEF